VGANSTPARVTNKEEVLQPRDHIYPDDPACDPALNRSSAQLPSPRFSTQSLDSFQSGQTLQSQQTIQSSQSTQTDQSDVPSPMISSLDLSSRPSLPISTASNRFSVTSSASSTFDRANGRIHQYFSSSSNGHPWFIVKIQSEALDGTPNPVTLDRPLLGAVFLDFQKEENLKSVELLVSFSNNEYKIAY
jgi:hypothetical protein